MLSPWPRAPCWDGLGALTHPQKRESQFYPMADRGSPAMKFLFFLCQSHDQLLCEEIGRFSQPQTSHSLQILPLSSAAFLTSALGEGWVPGEFCACIAEQTVGCGNGRKIFGISLGFAPWVTPQLLLRNSGFLRAVPVPPLLFLLHVKTELIKGWIILHSELSLFCHCTLRASYAPTDGQIGPEGFFSFSSPSSQSSHPSFCAVHLCLGR